MTVKLRRAKGGSSTLGRNFVGVGSTGGAARGR